MLDANKGLSDTVTVDKTHNADNLCKHTHQDKHKVCVPKLLIAR